MPTTRQSVPKHMALARDPFVEIGRFSVFLAKVGPVDFSISIGIHSLPPETAWFDSQPFFLDNFANLPEQSPYRSLDERPNQRRLQKKGRGQNHLTASNLQSFLAMQIYFARTADARAITFPAASLALTAKAQESWCKAPHWYLHNRYQASGNPAKSGVAERNYQRRLTGVSRKDDGGAGAQT